MATTGQKCSQRGGNIVNNASNAAFYNMMDGKMQLWHSANLSGC